MKKCALASLAQSKMLPIASTVSSSTSGTVGRDSQNTKDWGGGVMLLIDEEESEAESAAPMPGVD